VRSTTGFFRFIAIRFQGERKFKMEESLLEYTDSRGATLSVDRETGVIRGVKILGAQSRNGRVYPQETLVKARELYEGAKVNVNHPKGAPTSPRDYQDRIGLIRNVSVAEAGLFGDLHFNPRHGLAAQLEWDAQHAPENVGLSHNVTARTTQREERTVVDAITRVVSVDLVADPASTHGLYEQLEPQLETSKSETSLKEVLLREATLEQLKAARPDLLEQLRTSERTEPPTRIRSRDQQSVERDAQDRNRKVDDADTFVKAISYRN